MTASRMTRDIPSTPEILRQHQSILESSQLKIVLLSGFNAETTITSIVTYDQQHKLQLRSYSYNLYIKIQDDGSCRLYVSCPRLPFDVSTTTAQNTARLTEIIKFACLLTQLNYIRPNLVQSAAAWMMICTQRARELAGEVVCMTTDTIDDRIHAWLLSKGFTCLDAIRELEELAGSLTYGLIALMNTLPKNPSKAVAKPPRLWTTNSSQKAVSISNMENWAKAIAYCDEVIRKQEKYLKKRGHDEQSTQIISPSAMTLKVTDRNRSLDQPEVTRLKRKSEHFTVDNQIASKRAKQHHQEDSEGAVTQATQSSYDKMVGQLPDPDSVLILDDAESEEIFNVEVFEVEDEKQSIFDDDRHSSLCDEYLDEILDVLQPQTDSSPYEQVTSPRYESIDDVVESIAAIKASFRLYGKRAKEKRETLTAAITWRTELHRYQHMLYPFKVPPNKRGECKVVPGGCPLIIPQNADIVNDDVKIKVHTVGPDERHPRVFAVDAEEQDMGKRIAFELFWTTSQGETVTYWPTGRNRKNVYRAKSFADKLLLQLELTDIRHKERRYVKWPRGAAPRGYEDCEGGLYTSPVD